jgi:hypothetical protein
MNVSMNRRGFIGSLATRAPLIAAIQPWLTRAAQSASTEKLPAVRQITRGPRFHWFGYYDKLQFSADNRFVLGNEVEFEGRSPTADDHIRVGMVDLQEKDKWIELGSTHAWNWQQGCMLQWLPGPENEVIWNDREADHFVARILNVHTRKVRTLPNPIYAISPDGKSVIAPDFRRLNDCRPGYGYAGIPDPNRDSSAPDDAGIWHLDLNTSRQKLLFSFADAAKVPFTGRKESAFLPGAKHWFNHLLFNTDGTRFFFLHRWRNPGQPMTKFQTRAFTCDANGQEWFCLDPYGATSHFIWRDARHIMAWAWHPSHGDKFYLYTDQSTHVEVVGLKEMTENGHNTYLPRTGNQWILNDTYPDASRLQHPYLFHLPSSQKIPLGHFYSPPEYAGEWRCDTHPRSSRDGGMVCIDSPHSGGRQMYLIKVKDLVA